MFHKVLVAIDGSSQSLKSLERAIDEAKTWNAELHAIYVVEIGLFSSLPVDNTWEIMYSLLEKEGKEVLSTAAKKAEDVGVVLTGHLKQGHAGEEIITLAEDQGADLIVVGSLGKSNIERLLLGSVSSFVVMNSRITTMVVRE